MFRLEGLTKAEFVKVDAATAMEPRLSGKTIAVAGFKVAALGSRTFRFA